jgi:gluconolactonase
MVSRIPPDHEHGAATAAGPVPEESALQRLAGGFLFTEGPIFHPRDHYLLFSDMPGDVRRRWDTGGVRRVREPSNKCNGMTYDRQLNLIVCEHATSTLVREAAGGGADGPRAILASHFSGKELNSPNDVVVGPDDSIYFTDPVYGRRPGVGVERPQQLSFQGVYRVTDDPRAPELLIDDFDQPNGLCFSPDGRTLYVNDTTRGLIRAFDVSSSGGLSGDRIFMDQIGNGNSALGAPDGMKTDEAGHVYVTGPGGIWVISPAGDRVGVIAVPEKVANLNWGMPDWQTLFICASTSLYSIRLAVRGSESPYMQAATPAPGAAGDTTAQD